MVCEEIMTSEVGSVAIGQTVVDAARVMRELNVGFVPVCQSDDTVLGTLTDRDIVLRVVAADRAPSTAVVQDVMSNDLVACRPEDDVRVAERLMRANQVSRVLVIDEAGKLAGVISLSDLAQYENE